MSDLSLRFLAPHPWTLVLLFFPAAALAIYAYYRILAPLSRPARWALWGLRGAAFAVVLLALMQPVLTTVQRDTGKPGLAVLVDISGSMALPSGIRPGEDRSREAGRIESEIRSSLSDRYRLQWYSFSDHLLPSAPDSSRRPAGNTAVGSALEEALTAAQNRPVSGILLLSDGVNTAGRDPVRVAAASPVPIYTVGLGPERAVRDAAVHRVRSNPTAYAGEPLPIQVTLSSWGMGGSTARVEVLQGREVLTAKEVPLIGQNGLEQEAALEVRPRAPGLTLYTVRVSAPGDSIPQNDVREIAADVLDRKTRILVLAPHLDWDFTFLRRALAADTTLSYSFLVQTAPGRFRCFGERVPERWPEGAAELRPFAAVLLAGIADDVLPAATGEALARFVREGGGLFVLGGPERNAAWAVSGALADVLPGRVVPDPLPSARALPVTVTLEGQRHPVTSIRDNPGETAQQWASLPPIYRPRGSLSVKPQAKVLLEYRGGARGPGLPALAVAFEDRGKTAWLFGRGAWRWGFNPSADQADRADLYGQFLLGLVRWLAEPAVRDRFQVTPGKRVFQNGEPATFTASLFDAAYAPVAGAAVEVRVFPDSASGGNASAGNTPDGASGRAAAAGAPIRIACEPGSESGQYDGQGPALTPGAYRYTAEARDAGGGTLGRAEGRFWCETMGPETARSWRDSEQLAQIAHRSGGASGGAEDLAGILEQIPRTIRRLGRIREIDVWNHWLLFAGFVSVLSVEWFLRRRRGLA